MLFRNTLTSVSPHVISHGSFKHCIVSAIFMQRFTYRSVKILFVSQIFAMWWAFRHIGSVWLASTRTLSHPNWAFTQPCNINSHSYPLKLTPEPQQTFWDQMGSEWLAGKPTHMYMHAIGLARKLLLSVFFKFLKKVCRGQHCALWVSKCENDRNRIL